MPKITQPNNKRRQQGRGTERPLPHMQSNIKGHLLSTVPEGIHKDFVVLYGNRANSTAKLECTLEMSNLTTKRRNMISVKRKNEGERSLLRTKQQRLTLPTLKGSHLTFLNMTVYSLLTQVPSGNIRRGLLSDPCTCSLNLKDTS